MVSGPQWSGWKRGQMLMTLMDAACCLPYLQAHSLGIHSASRVDFSCPLFKPPPAPQLQREQKFVEAHPSNQWNQFCSFLIGYINLFCHSRLVQSWQAILNSWIWEEMNQRDWGAQFWTERGYVCLQLSLTISGEGLQSCERDQHIVELNSCSRH